MNTFIATVTKIDTVDSLNIVKFDFLDQTLSMMSLDLNDNVKVGTAVELTMKPTIVAIGKGFSGIISYSNQLKAKIVSIDNGELLSSINLQIQDIFFESIITLDSSKKMDLKVGDEVTAFIKASELSILRVIDA